MGNPPSVQLAMKRITALSAAPGAVAVQTDFPAVNLKLGECQVLRAERTMPSMQRTGDQNGLRSQPRLYHLHDDRHGPFAQDPVILLVTTMPLHSHRMFKSTVPSPHDCRYKLFIGVGGITCILGGDLQSSSEEVRSVLIIFKLFNVSSDRPKPDVIGPLR